MCINDGKLICITGLDGSGKTTQYELLKNWSKEKNYKFEFYSTLKVEKQDTINYRKCIDFIKQKKIKDSNLMFHIYRTFELVEFLQNKMIPNLEKGKIIITDRYIESIAVRFHMWNLPLSWIDEMLVSYPKPTLSIFLDTFPDNCIRRLEIRDVDKGIGENYNELVDARKFYLNNINKLGLNVIDGNASVNEVFLNIIQIIEECLI